MFGGLKHRDKFNFFADPNLGAVPKTPQGSSPIFAILRELTEINSKKLLKKKKKKKRISFPALAVVVAKASYMKVTVPFWFYCKLI